MTRRTLEQIEALSAFKAIRDVLHNKLFLCPEEELFLIINKKKEGEIRRRRHVQFHRLLREMEHHQQLLRFSLPIYHFDTPSEPHATLRNPTRAQKTARLDDEVRGVSWADPSGELMNRKREQWAEYVEGGYMSIVPFVLTRSRHIANYSPLKVALIQPLQVENESPFDDPIKLMLGDELCRSCAEVYCYWASCWASLASLYRKWSEESREEVSDWEAVFLSNEDGGRGHRVLPSPVGHFELPDKRPLIRTLQNGKPTLICFRGNVDDGIEESVLADETLSEITNFMFH